MQDAASLSGFRDPVHESQHCFRAVLTAMAHPGTIVDAPIPAMTLHNVGACAAIALTLLDLDTPVWLDRAAEAQLGAWLRFHAAPPVVGPQAALFALALDPMQLPGLESFPTGSDEEPERGATLVLAVPALGAGTPLRVSGPGVSSTATLAVAGLPAGFWPARAAVNSAYPRGLDLILCARERIAALPRTAIVEPTCM